MRMLFRHNSVTNNLIRVVIDIFKFVVVFERVYKDRVIMWSSLQKVLVSRSAFVCLFWFVWPSGVFGTDVSNSSGVCKLNGEAASVLCAVAKLLEGAKNTVHKYKEKYARDALNDVKWHKQRLDREKELLDKLLEEAKTKQSITSEEVDKIQSIAHEAETKTTEESDRANKVMAVYKVHYDHAKKSTKTAKGEALTPGSCQQTYSLLDILQCHVVGEEVQGKNISVSEVCEEEAYHKHFSEQFWEQLAECNEVKTRKYCGGLGDAIQTALEKWKIVSREGADAGSPICTVQNEWESLVEAASDNMLQLDHVLGTIYHAKDVSLSYYSTVHQIRKDVGSGTSMKELLENARQAGQEGTIVMIQRKSGGPEVEERVKVTVRLWGLYGDSSSPTSSRNSLPKIYVYLLAGLIPLCFAVLGALVCFLVYHEKENQDEVEIPADSAAWRKVCRGREDRKVVKKVWEGNRHESDAELIGRGHILVNTAAMAEK
ncbi:unnamed protein product [Trypanosoma congolense IL3000]|uniref:WGS project CAEQ00000000 data, annotated contig 2054 n=1 Tax=Trypanosoma congolense (strain IL3000) TaxID=1068625 RepID=F9WB34_TRYCI|nr:unnamed protein product [Trypanosoma congolense IL3000]